MDLDYNWGIELGQAMYTVPTGVRFLDTPKGHILFCLYTVASRYMDATRDEVKQ